MTFGNRIQRQKARVSRVFSCHDSSGAIAELSSLLGRFLERDTGRAKDMAVGR